MLLLLQGAAAAGLLGQQRLQSCLLGASLLALQSSMIPRDVTTRLYRCGLACA